MRVLRLAPALLACGLLSTPTLASASECDRPDAAWLMCEDFEAGDQGWDAWFSQSQWTECAGCPGGTNDPERIRLENDPTRVHDGAWALHTPGGEAAGYQGGTLRYASCEGAPQSGCPLRGFDRLYFRTWVRLAADHDYVHHFVGLGGTRPDAYWNANGNAGCRPQGDRWAGTRVDLNPQHELFFYTYHPDMNCDSGGYCSGEYAQNICDGCAGIDMPCDDGPECCWGNHFSPEHPVVLPTETWTCLEMSMELNTPGVADGSMSFWVDDQLGHQASGLRWREESELQLNRAMLEHFIDPGDTDHPNQAWFDDVIVSTERIGCGSSPGGTGSTSDSGPDATAGGDDDSTGGPPPSSDSADPPTATTGPDDDDHDTTGTPTTNSSSPTDAETEGSAGAGNEDSSGCALGSPGRRGGTAAWLMVIGGLVLRRRGEQR